MSLFSFLLLLAPCIKREETFPHYYTATHRETPPERLRLGYKRF